MTILDLTVRDGCVVLCAAFGLSSWIHFPKKYAAAVFRLLTLSVDRHVDRFQDFALWQKSFRLPIWNSNYSVPFRCEAKMKRSNILNRSVGC